MKPTRLSLLALAAVMTAGNLPAQSPDSDSVYRALVEKSDNAKPPEPETEALVEPVVPAPAKTITPAPATTVVQPPATVPGPATDNGEAVAVEKKTIIDSEEGYLIKDANLNDIFQFLAKEANRQYFHNSKIATPEYRVTGHLNSGNPLQQMEELAFMYGLTLYTKGSTIYALTQAQLGQLPGAEFQYQLKYLRPTDMTQIKELIKPVLSPSGVVNFEPKTNTVIIIDNAQKIEAARSLLHDVDQAKGQIVVETKILRINSNAAERSGVDWTKSLGSTGTSIEIGRNLNSVFGINSDFGSEALTSGDSLATTDVSSNNLVLSPIQLNGVLRALNEGGLAKQVSNPTLITEDNEQATISIIDRVPIITSTTAIGTTAGSQTEEVRYKIDEGDSTIDKEPEKHREIGISLVVTPTLLPDGTVRMRMRPRSAQITEEIKSATSGNVYPRVTESMIETLARVPDGYSLIVGGFYGETQKNTKSKVPLLGDVPVLNFFFKSKELSKENTSLVFIVTPKSYDPRDRCQTRDRNLAIRDNLALPADHDWADPNNAGPGHEPNMRRSIRGLKPDVAPYYPQTVQPAAQELIIDENCDSAKAVIVPVEPKAQFSRARR